MKLKIFFLLLTILFATIFLRIENIKKQRLFDAQVNSLFYEISGIRLNPLVYLHGILGSHQNWNAITQAFKQDHQNITLDLLGFGNSAQPDIDYSVEQHVTMIENTLKPILANEKFYLIGHSMGALLALNFAESHSENLKGLILINPPMKNSAEELQKSVSESSSTWLWKMISNPYFGDIICHVHELIPSISLPFIRLIEPDLDIESARSAGQHTLNSYKGSLQNIILNQKLDDLLKKINTVPILILVGKTDQYQSDDELKKIKLLKNIQLVQIEGDHLSILKKPAQTVLEIKKFIQ